MQAYENFDLRGGNHAKNEPAVRFIFEFPELLLLFEEADPRASKARLLSRRLGMASIGLVLAALLIASADPMLEAIDPTLRIWIGYGAAGLGLVGTLIGLATMGKSSPRARWLQGRLQTELLRLFHFHYVSLRLPEGLAASGDPDREKAFLADRAAALERMRQALLADPAASYAQVLADREHAPFAGLVEASTDATADTETAGHAFTAWRELRLEWQLGYCEAKLALGGDSSSPRRQETWFSRIAWTCIALIVGLHFLHFFEHALHLPRMLLQTAVIWTALIALGARALESGLAPQREVERYEQYRSNIRVAMRRFDNAQTAQTRLEIMRAFEATSQEEMLVFIRTHAHSHFLL